MNSALVRKLAIRYSIGLVVGAAFAALWGVLQRTGLSWAWVVFVPALIVLYLLGEWAFEPFFTPEAGSAISESRFSALRIGAALLLVLPYFAVLLAVGVVIRGPVQ
jgi:hypothetical protein